MHKNLEGVLQTGPAQWTGPGTVEFHAPDGETLAIAIDRAGQRQAVWATPLARTLPLEPGDEVLVLCDSAGRAFVIDRLASAGDARAVTASDGSIAGVEQRDGSETLVVRAPDGSLIAEHDPRSGVTRLSSCAGAIELEPGDGLTSLSARGVLAMDASVIAMRARTGVVVSSGSADAGSSEIRLSPSEASLRASRSSLQTDRSTFRIGTLTLDGDRADATMTDASLTSERVEISAGTARSTVGTLIQTVTGAARVSVGRMALHARTMLRIRSERADVRTKKEVRIDGSEIHLG